MILALSFLPAELVTKSANTYPAIPIPTAKNVKRRVRRINSLKACFIYLIDLTND
jgi:hypothetical protein